MLWMGVSLPPCHHLLFAQLFAALQVVALHKDHYVFPLTLFVSKVSGSGADAVFMGVLRPLQDEPDTVKAWIMPAGRRLRDGLQGRSTPADGNLQVTVIDQID